MSANDKWYPTGEPTALELLDVRASTAGSAPFLTVADQRMTPLGLADASFSLVAFLVAVGIRKGDRVATLFENCPEAVIAFFGSVRAGAMVVPINSAYRATFLAHVLIDSGSSVVIC